MTISKTYEKKFILRQYSQSKVLSVPQMYPNQNCVYVFV